jgi:regulator of sirC expression with transglutaminase-like and TPR domain
MQILPVTCHVGAYELFAAQMPALDTTDGLLRAAVAVSMHAFDDVDPDDIDQRLSALAARVRSRLRGKSVQATLAHLHQVLFEEEGFSGNMHDYYHPLNSHLPAVLESRRGIPITLALVYKVVAERVGLVVDGINAPGHFLARVQVDRAGMIVDPFFRGTVLTDEEAYRRMEKATRRQVPRSADFLRAATHYEWISRILANLRHIFAAHRRTEDLAAMDELSGLLRALRSPTYQGEA